MKLTNPSLLLNFLGNDLEPGKQTQQTVSSAFILNRSVKFPQQLLNGLKSSSDSVSLQLSRNCASTEDIIATDGDIEAVLKDGEDTIFTGFVSTSFRWEVTQTGETALAITLEGRGTRLLSLPYIDTGKVFFDNTASAVIYQIATKVGISLAPGMDRVLLQSVSQVVEAGTTCKELLDQLCYECNAVYYFNNLGQLCIFPINPSTENAEVLTDNDLFVVSHRAVTLQKKLRTYKGARVQYWTHGTADNYLVYRNTTGASSQYPYCNLELQPGEYFDGIEIYSEADWSAATQDTFREPALIGAVNAESETQLVGSNQIVNISNLNPVVEKGLNLSAEFENVGGGYFKLTCHNSGNSPRSFFRLDLYASIVYQKSIGVIRTQIDGVSTNKTLLEEEMKWIHTKEDAQKHANLLAQYHQFGGATYTFNSKKKLSLGSVIHLQENLHSGLDVYVMLIAREETHADVISYTAVGISTFNLDSPVYYGQTEEAKETGKQGPQGEPGATTEIQYALGDSIIEPPTSEMTWGGEPMLWNGEVMTWNADLYSDEVPEMQRGKYIWMRSRVGNGEWNYTRLTGAVSWDAESLGVATTETPKTSSEGLGLIPGDFFVAGATFTEDSVEYKKGYAYIYNGATWDVMDLSLPDNAQKAQNLAAALFSSGINVTDSTASIWGWFQNMVAQDASIKKLNATEALFENIHVSGDSLFDGNLFSRAIKTYDASSGGSVSFSTTGGRILVADLLSVLGAYGNFVATAGSISTVDINGGLTHTYTASEGDPIYLLLSANNFVVRQNSSANDIVEGRIDVTAQIPTLYLSRYDNGSISVNVNCSLTLASEGAGARVTTLKPESSSSSLGTSDSPFPKIWVGNFGTTMPVMGSPNPQGYCSLSNGLMMKWGEVKSSENTNVARAFHSYTQAEGGAFPNATLFVVIVGQTFCHVNAEMWSSGNDGKTGFAYHKTALTSYSDYTSGAGFNFLAIGF